MSYRKTQRISEGLPGGWETRRDLLSICSRDPPFLSNLPPEVASISGNAELLEKLFFPTKSWRLSRIGFLPFSRTYAGYSFSNPENLFSGSAIMALCSGIKGPWYIAGDRIHLWDPTFQFELAMFDGNINRYARFNGPK